MGKCTKKPKIAGDVAVMEVSPQSSLGVRTRAKTLALQRLQKLSSCEPDPDDSSYLQLRSRRLEKVVFDSKKQQLQEQPKKSCRDSPKSNYCGVNSRFRESSVKSVSVKEKEEFSMGKIAKGSEEGENNDMGLEASLGENMLETESRDRSTRESTPCSLIRDSSAIGTPGSTTRQRTSTTNQMTHVDILRNIPTDDEIEEFFAYAEKQQQRIFMDKYNFDFVNDIPLPGRFDWVQVLQ
ncbi:hypothetical protein L6164_000445 [Bauhinia variegata]|uniref:Uncharacterized protein n=1 Tax=Bauhinia variegata TaxID=167791 RepID=A0ACB9Q6P1_BAUVA|nr:hypothetical protein L6164_000445 [Bauhinia variegata]